MSYQCDTGSVQAIIDLTFTFVCRQYYRLVRITQHAASVVFSKDCMSEESENATETT